MIRVCLYGSCMNVGTIVTANYIAVMHLHTLSTMIVILYSFTVMLKADTQSAFKLPLKSLAGFIT